MTMPYGEPDYPDITQPAAEEIISLLEKKRLSYNHACEALAIAQDKLGDIAKINSCENDLDKIFQGVTTYP